MESNWQNKWCLTNRNEVVGMKYITKRDNGVFLICGCSLDVQNYFEFPAKSSTLNIYCSGHEESNDKE